MDKVLVYNSPGSLSLSDLELLIATWRWGGKWNALRNGNIPEVRKVIVGFNSSPPLLQRGKELRDASISSSNAPTAKEKALLKNIYL